MMSIISPSRNRWKAKKKPKTASSVRLPSSRKKLAQVLGRFSATLATSGMFWRRNGLTVVRNLAPRLLKLRRPVWIMKKPITAAAEAVIPVTVSRPRLVGAGLGGFGTMRMAMTAAGGGVVLL